MQRFSDLWYVATKVVTLLGFRKNMWDSYPHERRIMRSATELAYGNSTNGVA